MDGRDRAIVAVRPGTVVRDHAVLNALWLFVNGYTVDANRETIVDPGGGAGFAIDQLGDAGLTPATRAA
jgi:hypothetical protein